MIEKTEVKKIIIHSDLSLDLKCLSDFYRNEANELDRMYILQTIRDLLFEVEGNKDID